MISNELKYTWSVRKLLLFRTPEVRWESIDYCYSKVNFENYQKILMRNRYVVGNVKQTHLGVCAIVVRGPLSGRLFDNFQSRLRIDFIFSNVLQNYKSLKMWKTHILVNLAN